MSYLDEADEARRVYYANNVSIEVFDSGGEIQAHTGPEGYFEGEVSPESLRELAEMFEEAADGMEKLQAEDAR